ncbi:MAG: hypothetical protein WAM14_01010 [Candidatus Nitrosopolaris sp.]
MNVEERISKIQAYIDAIELLYHHPLTTGEQKSQALTYWGFAKMIKELFELHLTEPSTKTQEEINEEKKREETVDWMTRWLEDQTKDLEKP